jgi:hypothetical protein
MSANGRMMKGMVIGGIGAFAFVFLFEFLVLGFLMTGMYQETLNVWRPQAESSMTVMMLSQFLFAMAVAFFYPIVGPDKGCKKPFLLDLALD